MKTLIKITIILAVLLAIFFTMKDSRRIKNLHTLYPRLTLNDSLKGRVDKLHIEKGAIFVSIEGKCYFIHTAANYLYPQIHLHKTLAIGDSIIKHSGNDSIFLYKENIEFIFVNDKRINR
ncbi:hypothetical protein L3049_10575 [Labilibaculum sp. DW002]|uniref:Uncharacterized protein n=1 Tax=Paralabilibaculum antarcticum TaxID=2912572 RepID=A0ABT5VVB5_9BACT|nr:hypothetical protein [Labilibaculum sp. DW002]MDE5418453.1 hypothetical protein [Labilibaculum sp. DW002]